MSLDPRESVRRFPPRPQSARAARGFVRAVLEGAEPAVVDAAELLTGELVTNAVLHARTEVEVRVRVADGVVRARVGDLKPDRPVVSRQGHLYAATGWGLGIVERLAARHGVDVAEDHKAVWFELRPDTPPPATSWPRVPPPGPPGTVILVDLPYALYSAARQHRHALLRELVLADLADAPLGPPTVDLLAAHDANNLISACVAAALEDQQADSDIPTLTLAVPADAVEGAAALRRVLDLAEEMARQERLLARPALPHIGAFHRWLFDEIIGQLAGAHPAAWTLVPREPSARPSELAPWDARHVGASRVPTITAGDDNRIIAVNGPVSDLLGWSPDELVGQRITVLIPEHLRERHVSAFTSLLLTGEPRILGRSVPLPGLHRDGRLVPVRLFIQTQEAADGRTVFVAQLIPRVSAPPSAPGRSAPSRPAPEGEPEPDAAPERSGTTQTVAEPGVPADTGRTAWERLSLLADTRSALAVTPPYLMARVRRVGEILVERLADWCVVDLLDERDQARRFCVVHREPAALPPEAFEGPLPPVSGAAQGSLARVLRGAGPLLLTEIPTPQQAANALDARQLELFEQLGASSAVIAPLRARREVIGALTVARLSERRPFTEDDLPLLADVADGLALGVDNTLLYQETQQIAERLQRSLLPALPDTEDLQLAARYSSSSSTAHVGGDWYDAFLLGEGDLVLVIGDVTGHDLKAAVAMSALRNMLRGIAVDRREPPGEVLRRLDLASHTLYRQATATCIYAVVKDGAEEGSKILHHAAAGHLPPLLTTRDGDTRYLDAGAGVLIGMDPELPRPTACDTLPPHSTLLLYTDGLIERRGESLDDAMSRLRQHAAALAREPLDVFCDELLIGLAADTADDVALLALRTAPPP
ncbi:SpoIIE family protein phosphatase [Streptomyces misionensis]|uniref:SpoIIE family protein phosphatase n=1 Tax=Streptomyces misionensis TaxID=67331 RepID=UPI000945649C|nr:SpoIIE family protein phosphatase [Streptomyces misionensis]